MAQTGYTPIQLYYSSTTTNVPLAANLAYGELAINITDGKLFYKDNANAIQVIGWKVVPATAGGTGQTSYAVGDLLYADTTTTLAKLPDVATGNALISGGVSTAPSWGKIGLTTHVSGTLAVGNGGTGQSSNLTQYGVIYGSTTTAMASTSAGTTSQVLIGNASGAPSFTGTPSVTSIQGGNILVSGNTVQAQNTNGSISVLPNGTGFTKVALEKYSNTAGTVVLSAATPMATMAQLTLGAGTWILIGVPGGILSSGLGQAGDTQTYTINTSAAIPSWNSNVAAIVRSYYPQAANDFKFFGGSISLQVTLASSTTYYLYGGLSSITVSLTPVLNGTLYAVKISE